MRISYWSSDVCSSDLYVGSFLLPGVMGRLGREAPGIALDIRHLPPAQSVDALEADEIDLAVSLGLKQLAAIRQAPRFRSAARRLGNACVGTCRCRRSTAPLHKKRNRYLTKKSI